MNAENYRNDLLNALSHFLLNQQPPVLFSFLSKHITDFLKNRYPNLKKKKIQDDVRYYVNKAIKLGILEEKRIHKRDRELWLTDPARLVDLKAGTAARNQHERREQTQNNEEEGALKPLPEQYYFIPRYARQSTNYFWAAVKTWNKHARNITKDDISELTAAFERYIMDISDRVLLFRDSERELKVKNYRSRFITPSEAAQKLEQYNQAFETALSEYDKAIFLTITLPPVFPLKLSLYILSFLLHRIKALLRKHHGETLPHIRVNEPQRSLNPHVHVVIFGTDFLMNKRELTRYLDKHLENFLENLGEHYRMTINKRAKPEEVKGLNKLGKRFLKRYKRYKAKKQRKRKKRVYEGPINHITKVIIKEGTPIFQEAPPDANKVMQKQAENGGSKEKAVNVIEYLKYYLLKALLEAVDNAEDPFRKQEPELAFFWIFRLPFFFISPKLREPKEKPPPAGWEFIGSCTEDTLSDLIAQLTEPAQVVWGSPY